MTKPFDSSWPISDKAEIARVLADESKTLEERVQWANSNASLGALPLMFELLAREVDRFHPAGNIGVPSVNGKFLRWPSGKLATTKQFQAGETVEYDPKTGEIKGRVEPA